jgi:hypothetical protein
MRFSFAPSILALSIQEAGGLENALRASCKQREAKNGGQQLFYHLPEQDEDSA